MKLWTAFLAPFLLCAPAIPVSYIAAEPPAPTPADVAQLAVLMLPAYDTIEEAGVHGAQRAYQCSQAYECGGPIAQRPDGKYVVGPIHSDYDGASVTINHGVPRGWKLVGDYHSHPCNAESHEVAYFSPSDLGGNTFMHIIGFMVDLCTGQVHEFDPSRDQPDNEEPATSPGIHITQGRIIGHIVVSGISQEPNTGL
jgi:hypothetical protein